MKKLATVKGIVAVALVLGLPARSAGESPCTINWQCSWEEYCRKPDGACTSIGECFRRPDLCLAIWEPVCGCDGRTYGNGCDAAVYGVNVDYAGVCGGVCMGNSWCGPADFCNQTECGGTGVCEPRPTACPTLWDPVCGCDGVSYPNSCTAMMSGVSVAHSGECIVACGDNEDCAATEYCETPVGACTSDGACRLRPEACPTLWDPVCGCDGLTYGNSCDAAWHGVSIAHTGECDTPCTDNGPCGSACYCAKAMGDCPGAGTCEPMPTLCPPCWDPVCGCDGTTYPNLCVAASHGVSVDYTGPCRPGCIRAEHCPQGEYCQHEAGECESISTCSPRPQSCPDVWEPVYGCDGVIYTSACVAARAGTTVRITGCWPRIPGDLDGDCDVDEADFAEFLRCATGPAIPQFDPDCARARLDNDTDVDQSDFGLFQRCFGGSHRLGDASCAD